MLELVTQELLLPVWFVFAVTFLFGAVFGSFMDVCVSRFHTGKSINGRSQCMSCGKTLRWYELFPIFSYLVQYGRCRGCGSRIPGRVFLIEIVTGSLLVLAAVFADSIVAFVWLTLVLFVLLAITVYDYQHFIIPDEFSLALFVLTAGWLGYEWWFAVASAETMLWTIGSSVAGAAFFFALWAVSRGRWLGFGDVKLAIPLGLWVGWQSVFSFIVLSFWVGAAISVGILLFQKYGRGKQSLHSRSETLTMKSAVPFAPFMIAGAALTYFLHIDVLSLFSVTI